ncbi:MAG TPA: hypothetical protein VFO30_08385 [Chthoniobacterales bacterium]|nr:hypothetical protein [Chthoniobacterales bacterium]
MKSLVCTPLVLATAFSFAAAKDRHCTFRVHVEANARDTAVFASSVRAQVSGRQVAIERLPRISERDVVAFYPYNAGPENYGALLQLDDHGRIALDALSIEHRGSLLFVFVNGRAITQMQIDKRVADGKIYIPSGLSAADIDLMKKDWSLLGRRKR